MLLIKSFLSQNKKLLQSKSKDDINELEKERRAVWLAIRCAASVANTQRNRLLLIGDANVTSQKLTEKAQQELPDFISLDLVSSYVLGEKKKVYKSKLLKNKYKTTLTLYVQGSHKLWKLWKTWKITKKSSMHGKIMEFEKNPE